MLKRKIEKKLIAWKNTENRKPLIIKGCRQCGKTFSVLDFAKKNYKNVVYLNFFENPDYVAVFSGSLEVDTIVMMLSALLGKEAVFESGNTVLVLDEIQECPEARTALKFFLHGWALRCDRYGITFGCKRIWKRTKIGPSWVGNGN